MLRTQHVLVIASVVVAVAAALAYSYSQPNRYRATASVGFDNLSQDFAVVGGGGAAPEAPSALALRKSQTLLSADTLDAALTRLGGITDAAQLRRQVTAAPEVTSNLVVITAEAGDATQAAAIANAVAKAAVGREIARTRAGFASGARDLRRRYEALPLSDRSDASTRATYKERISRLDALASVATPARLDERAVSPSVPFSPRPVRSGLVAGFVGLLLGLGLAFARHGLDRRLHGSESIRAALNLPIVGQVREEAMGKAGLTQGGTAPLSDVDLEGFRILRANMDFLGGEDTKTVLVTSALPQEGKSTVAASLAWATATSGRRTLLVECDLRRPTLAGRLGVDTSPGLVELLAGDAQMGEVKRVIALPSPSSRNGSGDHVGELTTFDCVLAGRAVVNPARLLGSAALGRFLEANRPAYDVVIIDSAPLLPVVDTLELFSKVDVAILCVRDGRTTRDQAKAARELLQNLDRPIAVVITGLSHDESAQRGYYYSHAYG